MIKILVIFLVFLRLQYVISSTNQTILFGYSIKENNNNAIKYNKYNLNNLLNTFSTQATNKRFYNFTTFGQKQNTNQYGLYMCRGDIDQESCRVCVEYAKEVILEKPSYNKEVIAWYDKCMLRYSNEPFFGKLNVVDKSMIWNHDNIVGTNTTRFKRILRNTLNYLAIQTAYGREGNKFATKVVKSMTTKDENLYILMQCTPDLTSNDCHKCLRHSIKQIGQISDSKSGMVMQHSCMVRYEIFPFFYNDKIKSVRSPPTSSTQIILQVRVQSLPLDDDLAVNSTPSSIATDSPTMIKFKETSPSDNITIIKPTIKKSCCFRPVFSNSTMIKRDGFEDEAKSE